MKRFILFLIAIFLLGHDCYAALTADGSAKGSTVVTTTCTGASITTALTNDILVVTALNTATRTVSSVTDTALLTWTQRQAQFCTGARCGEEWWALAPAALTADAIVVHYSGAPTSCAENVIAINGANTTTPFDANVSLPAITSGASVTSLSVNAATTNTNTVLVMWSNVGTGYTVITRPSGVTNLLNGTFNDVDYKVLSSPQSSTAEAFSWTGGAQAALLIVDAVQAPGGGAVANGPLMGTGF